MNEYEQKLRETVLEILDSELEDKVAALMESNSKLIEENQSRKDNEVTLSMPLSFSNKRAIDTHVVFPITVSLVGTLSQTSTLYDVFFTADNAYEVVSVSETHKVLGTGAGDVTLSIEKLTPGQALDAGTELLSAPLDLKTTINTPQFGTLVSTNARILSRGDRLALKDSGTLTSLQCVVVTVFLRRI